MNSEELQKKALEILERKVPNAACPLCGTEDWAVQLGQTFLPLEVNLRNSSSFNQQAVTCVMLTCNFCGNTHLLKIDVLTKDAS